MPALSGSQRALMFARSGLMRSGASRSDYFREYPIVLIGGVDKIRNIFKKTLVIENLLNEQADTAHFRTWGFAPSAGQSIVISTGSASNRIFGGTIQRATQQSVRGYAKDIWEVDCIDWTATLNKRRVFRQYAAGQAAHVIVIDLVNAYSTGFTAGRVKTTSPTLSNDVQFRGARLFDAIQEVAQLANWHAYPDPNQVIHFFDTETDQSPVALQVGTFTFDQLQYALDISQIQTRIYAAGGGAQTTAPVAVAATTIPVNECGWYSATGGQILSGSNVITYTSVSAASGPGDVTGVSGVSYAIQQGDTCNVFVQADDAAAQAAVAVLEGGDGIHEGWVEDGRWSLATTIAQAAAKLAALKSQDIRGSYTSYDKFTRAGKPVTINIAARSISSTTVILQRVSRRLAAQDKWIFDAEFAIAWSDVIDVLAKAAAA